MAKIKGTTGVGATIAPASDTSKFPATSEQWHKGGYKSFASIAERDEMLASYKKDGMLCYIVETKEFFLLESDEWKPVVFGGADSIDLSLYALKAELPSLEQVEKDLDDLLDITNTKADKAELENLATKDELDEKIAGAQLGGGDVDTSDLATKTELETKLDKAEFENEKANFATKDEIANAGGGVSISAEPDNNLEMKDDGLYSNGVSKAQLDEFDTQAYKDEVSAFIDEAKKDVLTIDKFDEFDTQAYKQEIDTYMNEAKKDILTLDKFDEFDTEIYRAELNTIADEVKEKMAIFDEITELDIDELKAQIKAEILAELRG